MPLLKREILEMPRGLSKRLSVASLLCKGKFSEAATAFEVCRADA